MQALNTIRKYLGISVPETDPAEAYDCWAENYDHQPDNLVLALDEKIFDTLIKLTGKAHPNILDVGCGTGRHWKRLLALTPAKLVGYDVSAEMLAVLSRKFAGADLHLQSGQFLNEQDGSFDLVVSTLTLAHIPDAKLAIAEWFRVLKLGGHIILTDFHPEALSKGGRRTFLYKGERVSVKNHIHPLPKVLSSAIAMGLELLHLVERHTDESVREWYMKQDALPLYEKFYGTPIIYGCCLKKKYGTV